MWFSIAEAKNSGRRCNRFVVGLNLGFGERSLYVLAIASSLGRLNSGSHQ